MVSTVFCWDAQSIKHQIEERPSAQWIFFVHFGVIPLTQARKTKKTKKKQENQKKQENHENQKNQENQKKQKNQNVRP